jgi:hypothetical protein
MGDINGICFVCFLGKFTSQEILLTIKMLQVDINGDGIGHLVMIISLIKH